MNPKNSFKAQTFTYLPNKVFQKTKTQLVNPPSGAPVLTIELIKKGKITKNKRFFAFFDDRILYYKNRESTKVKGVSFFEFDLKLEWLFHHPTEEFDPNNTPFGFKLVRGHDVSELYFMETTDFQLVSQFLRKKLNIMNFHYWYKAIKKIGKGNFATVYLVESKETGFQYAVKAFLKDTLYTHKKGKESIKNEIQIMRALSHINVLELREVYETENSLYLVMELLKGGNMISLLSSKKCFSDKEIHIFLHAILLAVSHMHEQGVMHRDLKPENILLRNNEVVDSNICIADFGLSSFSNVEKFLFSRCGTPGFVAPEIFNYESKGKKYGAICDEFSVGVIFHVMLFGTSVFDGRSYNTVVKQNKECIFDFKKPLYLNISKDAKDLLMRLLEIDPKLRITAKEALNHRFFSENHRNSLTDDEDNEFSVAQTLKSFNERKFDTKHIKELNDTLYIPIDLPDHADCISSDVESSHFLVTNKPCLNGMVGTCERLRSIGSTEDPMKFDFKGISSVRTNSFGSSMEKESPMLKKALGNNQKIIFYDRKSPHKISNFLEYGNNSNRIQIKCSQSNENQNNQEKEELGSPLTMKILGPRQLIARKNLSPMHKNSDLTRHGRNENE